MNPQQTVPSSGPTKVEPPTPEHPFIGAAPAVYVKTWDFGDSVVSIVLQSTRGGKPYWSRRVYANHNGFWKMEESYHHPGRAADAVCAGPKVGDVQGWQLNWRSVGLPIRGVQGERPPVYSVLKKAKKGRMRSPPFCHCGRRNLANGRAVHARP